MKKPLTLVIDDEADIRELLEITLNRMNIDSYSAADISSAKQLLKSHHFNLCLTDMRLPDGDGLDLVDYIQINYPKLPVAVISAHGNMDTAITAMKKGAFDFVSKPIDLMVLRQLVSNALNVAHPLERRVRHKLLGESQAMRTIRSTIDKVSRSLAPVYISGESGSGKELVARLIHEQSPRNNKPFIAVNCGAIPQELMESEFFGHKKGSFTGATTNKIGLFQAADGGTLFLDEIADLPLALQVKLLRAIQEKKIRLVGDQNEISVNIRLLSATHKNLEQMVQNNEFRQDLYYRINVISLTVPPLRERPEDIPELVQHLLIRLTQANQIPLPCISESALVALQNYTFMGNIRELENILERALTLYSTDCIDVEDLDLPVERFAVLTQITQPQKNVDSSFQAELKATNLEQMFSDFDASQTTLEEFLEKIETQILNQALLDNKWNKTVTAKSLGLTFRSLRYRLKKLGLE